MSRIEEMIKELCPKGVERVKLGDCCCPIHKGPLDMRNLQENGKFPVINSGKEITGYHNEYNNDCEAITIASRGEYAGYINYVNGKFWAGVLCYPYKLKEEQSNLLKYIFYILKELQPDIRHKLVSRGGIPAINKIDVENYFIPLPPLSVQREIVSVLDSFTSLIDKMKQEVEMRKRQMEYYREKVICEQSFPLKEIGEIGTIDRGSGLQKKDFIKEGIGCIHYGQIYTRLNSYCKKTLTCVAADVAKRLTKVHPGNLVIACTSENVEDVCKSVVWLGNEDIVTGGHACVFRHNENPKYIAYCFQTNCFFQQKVKYAYGAKVIDIKTEKLNLIKLPIPPLPVQRRIVATLDTFEAYITKMERLIALRQKQYEYYRERLLTFA